MLDLMQVCEVINLRVQNLLVAFVKPDADFDWEKKDQDSTTGNDRPDDQERIRPFRQCLSTIASVSPPKSR